MQVAPLPGSRISERFEEECMAVSAAGQSKTVSRNRFMVAVLGGVSTIIGLFYVGALLRYLYPKSSTEPPLAVPLSDQGVTDPATQSVLPFQNGVAGPFNYPTVPDKSVVVGVFIEKIKAAGPLATHNIRVVEQTCTHLGCPIAWVAADNRFECPCHGSQFNRNLSVYHGPASDPLWEHDFELKSNSITILGRK
jgi:Rieske Fe-S protein